MGTQELCEGEHANRFSEIGEVVMWNYVKFIGFRQCCRMVALQQIIGFFLCKAVLELYGTDTDALLMWVQVEYVFRNLIVE